MATFIGKGEPNPKHVYAVALYETGNTLEEVAEYFGVSRERIRQWFQNFEGVERHYGVERDPVRVLSVCRKATGLVPASKQLHMSSKSITDVLDAMGVRAAMTRLWRWRKESKQRRIADCARNKMLNELRNAAAELGRTPTIADINEKRAGFTYAHTNYYRLFGSLSNAQRLAGLKPNQTGKVPKRFRGYNEVPQTD